MKQLVIAFLLMLSCGAIAADIYRNVDADGRVTFTDTPTDGQVSERVEVQVAAPAAEPTEAESADAEEDAEPRRAFGAEVPRPSTREEIAANRADNCSYARQVAETYETARRLYRPLGDDEREYLSDDEIDQARAEAKANVATWCD